MALNANVIHAALMANRVSGIFPFAGFNFDRLAIGLATGVAMWGSGKAVNLGLTGTATGMSGTGFLLSGGTLLVVPPTVAILQGTLVGAGMVGPLSIALATVVTLGISQAFSVFGRYLGLAPTVAMGTDISKITISNAPTLVAVLMGTLGGFLGPGPALPMLAAGLGNGIASLLLLGTGTGVVTGTVAPSPFYTSGPTTSTVV